MLGAHQHGCLSPSLPDMSSELQSLGSKTHRETVQHKVLLSALDTFQLLTVFFTHPADINFHIKVQLIFF